MMRQEQPFLPLIEAVPVRDRTEVEFAARRGLEGAISCERSPLRTEGEL